MRNAKIHFFPSELKSSNIQNGGFHAIFSFEIDFEVDSIETFYQEIHKLC